MIEQLSIRWRPRQRQIKEKYDKLIGEGLPFRNVGGYPDDVEKAISALAPRDFPYSTGQVIVIDGGITLSRF